MTKSKRSSDLYTGGHFYHYNTDTSDLNDKWSLIAGALISIASLFSSHWGGFCIQQLIAVHFYALHTGRSSLWNMVKNRLFGQLHQLWPKKKFSCCIFSQIKPAFHGDNRANQSIRNFLFTKIWHWSLRTGENWKFIPIYLPGHNLQSKPTS